jgi:kinesin family protein 3/17
LIFSLKNKREEQRLLAEKLAQIERKIIVGGENLLEKAEAQAKLLEDNEKLLEKQKERQAQLKKIIDEKEVI